MFCFITIVLTNFVQKYLFLIFCLYSFADTLNRKNVIIVLGRHQRMSQNQIKTQGKNVINTYKLNFKGVVTSTFLSFNDRIFIIVIIRQINVVKLS